jgi:hypothetical protein
MFLKNQPVPFGRNPRIINKTWCETTKHAARGLAITASAKRAAIQAIQAKQGKQANLAGRT